MTDSTPYTAEQLAMVKKLTIGSIPFAERSGADLLEARSRYVKMLMPMAPNGNHIGTMYAGALFTLAELPGGALFMVSFDYSKFYPIVADLSIRFRRPATTDITVEASISEEEVARIQTEAERDGKSTYILELELKDATGEVVAIARGTFQARKIAR